MHSKHHACSAPVQLERTRPCPCTCGTLDKPSPWAPRARPCPGAPEKAVRAAGQGAHPQAVSWPSQHSAAACASVPRARGSRSSAWQRASSTSTATRTRAAPAAACARRSCAPARTPDHAPMLPQSALAARRARVNPYGCPPKTPEAASGLAHPYTAVAASTARQILPWTNVLVCAELCRDRAARSMAARASALGTSNKQALEVRL